MDRRWQTTIQAAAGSHGVLSRVALLRLGWTRGEVQHRLARGQWRTLLVGTLLVDPAQTLFCSSWDDLPLRTRLSAARCYHGSDTVAVGLTAARLHGFEPLPPDDGTVHVRLAPGRERHQQAGVRLHTLQMAGPDIDVVDGFPVSAPSRTLTDVVLAARRDDAVALLDGVLRAGHFDRQQLLQLRADAHGRRGVRRSWRWWELADAGAQSPLETRIRLIAIDAGLPPDRLQHPVTSHDGRLLGFGDMAWDLPGGRVLVAEADGAAFHDQPSALFRDRRRANDFLATGRVDMVRFTWGDTRVPSYVVGVLRQHLGPHLRRRS